MCKLKMVWLVHHILLCYKFANKGLVERASWQMKDSKPTSLVLVVDDSPVARKSVEHALPKDEYTLLFASTGREARTVSQRTTPL